MQITNEDVNVRSYERGDYTAPSIFTVDEAPSGAIDPWLNVALGSLCVDKTNAVVYVKIANAGADADWMQVAADAYAYLGPVAEGSWRFYDDGTDLQIQRYESATWTTKSTVTA